MHKLLLVVIFLISSSILFGQYTVSSFQDEYQEIEDYNSIALETLGDPYWGKRFELDFEFPYFDQNFDHLDCSGEGLCSFDGEINFSMRLFTFGYMYDNIQNINHIPSDVRYKFSEVDQKKVLIIQFTRNRLFSDSSIELFDSYINFQWWFFEDGTIEIRFGPSNLENSDVYVPGEGFYLLTNQGPIPAGPQVALYHPYDESIKLSYGDIDSHEEFEISYTEYLDTDYVPPSGWVIRFENTLTALDEFDADFKDLLIAPNPASNSLHITSDYFTSGRIEILDAHGRNVSTHDFTKQLDISTLPNGMYFVKMSAEKGFATRKFIKQ